MKEQIGVSGGEGEDSETVEDASWISNKIAHFTVDSSNPQITTYIKVGGLSSSPIPGSP